MKLASWKPATRSRRPWDCAHFLMSVGEGKAGTAMPALVLPGPYQSLLRPAANHLTSGKPVVLADGHMELLTSSQYVLLHDSVPSIDPGTNHWRWRWVVSCDASDVMACNTNGILSLCHYYCIITEDGQLQRRPVPAVPCPRRDAARRTHERSTIGRETDTLLSLIQSHSHG